MSDINSQIDQKFNVETQFAVVINAILENKYNNKELDSNKDFIIKNANAYCKIKNGIVTYYMIKLAMIITH